MNAIHNINDTQLWFINGNCKTLSSPEMCPNTWHYIEENNEWKIDTELKMECGKF